MSSDISDIYINVYIAEKICIYIQLFIKFCIFTIIKF